MGVGEGCVVRMSVPVNDVPDVAGTDNLADIAVEWEEGDVERCAYGCEEVGMAARVEGRKVTIKMDSGCSRCMSGVPGRIKAHSEEVDVSKVVVRGFNDSKCGVDGVGLNEDGKLEYFLNGMPDDLVLLSAYEYAREGAVVLDGDGGAAYVLNEEQRSDLRIHMSKYTPSKMLCVNNRTYDVVTGSDVGVLGGEHAAGEHAGAATTYFNTKVNVSNAEERIMVYLMSGLTMRDLFKYVERGSVTGLHPDVTVHALNRFKHKWGSTPDVYQLAHPSKEGNRKGYMSEAVPPAACGEVVEMDYMECDFNDTDVVQLLTEEQKNGLKRRTKVKKLASHGGAIAANVSVDAYSGYIRGELVQTTARPIDIVKRCVQAYALDGHVVKDFAADSGVSSQSMFQVFTPEVDAYLLEQKIESHRAEPYNHSNGTPHVEKAIQTIKARIRMAVFYILRNPNFGLLQFTKQQILKLWGELFYWAVLTLNLSECQRVPGKTKYEVFKGRRPNIQEIRLLPIFSVVMVYRHLPNAAVVDQSEGPFYQYGLYVGPDARVTGAIRVAVVTNDLVQIIVTTKYKGVSDGGGINIYPHVERGLQQVLQEPAPGAAAPAAAPPPAPITFVDTENVRQGGGRTGVPILAPARESAVQPAAQAAPLRGELRADGRGDASEEGRSPEGSGQEQLTPDKYAEREPEQGEGNSSDSEQEQWVQVVRKKMKKPPGAPRKAPEPRVIDRSKWRDRAARMAARNREDAGAGIVDEQKVVEPRGPGVGEGETARERPGDEARFCDWSNYAENEIMYSFGDHCYYSINCKTDRASERLMFESGYVVLSDELFGEMGYRAVTKNVPKNFSEALKDPTWGEAARTELSGLTDKRTLVLVDKEVAQDDMRRGADLVILFPIYEEKIKEGKLVRKVRLVCNGKTQYNAGPTYAPTPTKEELFIVLHMCAKLGWDYCHIDEVRAFLNAPYMGENHVYAKLRKDPNHYRILGALYGLRTSPRHYNSKSASRLIGMGFTRLHMCSCIFKKRYENGHVVLVYAFVDDYICFGSDRATTAQFIEEFRKEVTITEPAWNATSVLGMTLTRDWERKTIQVSMANKITELGDKLEMSQRKVKHVPIPASGYIVKDEDFDAMEDRAAAEYLDRDDVVKYMQIVGSLVWISGVRHDIDYALMYLTWFTKKPRVHHMTMAYYLVSYLYHSRDIPMVLGGDDELDLDVLCDASFGTGPKGRSIIAVLAKLGRAAACIAVKATASLTTVRMSSFEAELEGCTLAFKTLRRIANILEEMEFELKRKPKIYNDNEAMINFVKGEGVAKGIHHVELRMWFIREQYAMGHADVVFLAGKELPADRMTKPSTKDEFREYRHWALGLGLLGVTAGQD